MKKTIRRILIIMLLALIVIQFIRIDKTNPVYEPSDDIFQKFTAEDEMIVKIKEACYDCHSNHVEYPWYTNIQPVGWWIKKHVNEGSGHLNFSEFGTYADDEAHHKLEECIEMLEEEEMPLKSFTWMHSEAKLSPLEREAMIEWFKEKMESYNM